MKLENKFDFQCDDYKINADISKKKGYEEDSVVWRLNLKGESNIGHITFQILNDRNLCIIEDLGIDPKYQRRGIGNCLLNEVKKEERCETFKVMAEPRAFVFYEKYGFTPSEHNYKYFDKIRELSKNKYFDRLEDLGDKYGDIEMWK